MKEDKKIRGVLKRIFILAFVYMAAIFPTRYINNIFGYLPLLFVTVSILLSFISFLIIKRGVRFTSDMGDAICYRGEKIGVSLSIENRSFLMCPKAVATVYISDIFGDVDTESKTVFTMDSKNKSSFSFDITMDHIGVYTAGIEDLVIYDFLGLFYSKVNGENNFNVTVLPNVYEFGQKSLKDQLLTESMNTDSAKESDGWDYTGVREYALGDSMKRIHWKLSAHSNVYMTKITETSQKCDAAVILDFVSEKYDNEALAYINDTLVEAALSCIEDISKKQMDYSLVFQNINGEIDATIPKGEDDYLMLVSSFPVIGPLKSSDTMDAADIIMAESRMASRSTNIIVFTSRITEELINQLISVKKQRRNPILYYVLPKGLNSKEQEKKLKELSSLDSNGVLYSHIVAGDTEDAK